MESVISDYNKRLIQLSVIQLSGGHCITELVISDFNKRLIQLSVIQSSGGHCTTKFLLDTLI